ncbi:MAG TPA: hypothetical protein K8V27_05865, partial [Butyricicoccus pullicaecorum]|nr:hypothetical protein [Butyricicoccus pullicaecorum]
QINKNRTIKLFFNLTHFIILPRSLQCIPQRSRIQTFIFSTLLKIPLLWLGRFVNFAPYALATFARFGYNKDIF